MSIQPTRPHSRLAFAAGFGDMHVKRFSNRTETSCLPLLNAGFEQGSLEPNLQQTECPLTNRRRYQGSSYKNLISTAHPYIHTYIHTYMFLCELLCSGTGKPISNWKETRLLLNAGFESKVSDTKSPADWSPADKPIELSRIKLKSWTQHPVPMFSEH